MPSLLFYKLILNKVFYHTLSYKLLTKNKLPAKKSPFDFYNFCVIIYLVRGLKNNQTIIHKDLIDMTLTEIKIMINEKSEDEIIEILLEKYHDDNEATGIILQTKNDLEYVRTRNSGQTPKQFITSLIGHLEMWF